MDAITPKGKGPTDLRSHLVRAAEMEWQQTRFPGCEAKTLLFDPASGLVTALMRFAPDAGLTVGPGEFVWRPAGSRHVAWAPEGGLMLAMFQIPNKFYERDGRVTDVAGQDWETVWGRALKQY